MTSRNTTVPPQSAAAERASDVLVVIALAAPVILSVPSAIIVTVAFANRAFGVTAFATPIAVLGVVIAATCGAIAFALLPAPPARRAVAVAVVVVLALIDLAALIALPVLQAHLGTAGLPAIVAIDLVLQAVLSVVPLALWLALRRRPRRVWWVLVLPMIGLVLGAALQSGLGLFGQVGVLLVAPVLDGILQQGAVFLAAVIAAARDPHEDR